MRRAAPFFLISMLAAGAVGAGVGCVTKGGACVKGKTGKMCCQGLRCSGNTGVCIRTPPKPPPPPSPLPPPPGKCCVAKGGACQKNVKCKMCCQGLHCSGNVGVCISTTPKPPPPPAPLPPPPGPCCVAKGGTCEKNVKCKMCCDGLHCSGIGGVCMTTTPKPPPSPPVTPKPLPPPPPPAPLPPPPGPCCVAKGGACEKNVKCKMCCDGLHCSGNVGVCITTTPKPPPSPPVTPKPLPPPPPSPKDPCAACEGSGPCVPCKGCANKARDAPCPTCTGGTCADCWDPSSGAKPCLGPNRQYCCECWKVSGPQCSGTVPPPVPPPTPPTPGVRYHCVEPAYKCAQQSDGHSTLAKCKDACIAPPVPPPAPTPPTPPTPPAPPPSPGKYATAHATIASVPGLTMGAPYAVEIAYPTSGGAGEKFPLISFAHGWKAGGSSLPGTPGGGTWFSYSVDITALASHGFVVVAPQSCPTQFCKDYSADQLAVIAAVRADPSLHPALATVDFSKVGVQGHSMGAMATVASASVAAAHGISAAVSQHPCGGIQAEVARVAVPIMYTSGSGDGTCHEQVSIDAFAASTASPTVLFSIAGAQHNEPCVRSSREDAPAALFMACHLRGEHCAEVSQAALCSVPFKMSHCEVKGALGGAGAAGARNGTAARARR